MPFLYAIRLPVRQQNPVGIAAFCLTMHLPDCPLRGSVKIRDRNKVRVTSSIFFRCQINTLQAIAHAGFIAKKSHLQFICLCFAFNIAFHLVDLNHQLLGGDFILAYLQQHPV